MGFRKACQNRSTRLAANTRPTEEQLNSMPTAEVKTLFLQVVTTLQSEGYEGESNYKNKDDAIQSLLAFYKSEEEENDDA